MIYGIVRKAWRRYRYTKYLNSDQWRRVRTKALKRAGYKCERCPETQGLEGHHKTYKRFGHERDDDIEILCHTCHKTADRERRQAVYQRRAYR